MCVDNFEPIYSHLPKIAQPTIFTLFVPPQAVSSQHVPRNWLRHPLRTARRRPFFGFGRRRSAGRCFTRPTSITLLSIFLLIACGFRKLAGHGVECQAVAAE